MNDFKNAPAQACDFAQLQTSEIINIVVSLTCTIIDLKSFVGK